MGGRQKINAKELARDIKAGMLDRDLIKKYGLSQESLRKALDKLVSIDLLNRDDIQERSGPPIPKPEDFVKCPACGLPQPRNLIECPNCNAIMTKVRDNDARDNAGVTNSYGFSSHTTDGRRISWGAVVAILVAFAVGFSAWVLMFREKPASKAVSKSETTAPVARPVIETQKEEPAEKKATENQDPCKLTRALLGKLKKGMDYSEVNYIFVGFMASRLFLSDDEIKRYPQVSSYIAEYNMLANPPSYVSEIDKQIGVSQKPVASMRQGSRHVFVHDRGGNMVEPEVSVWKSSDGAAIAVAFYMNKVYTWDFVAAK